MQSYNSFAALNGAVDKFDTCTEIFYKMLNGYANVRYYINCSMLEAIEDFIKTFPTVNKCEYIVRYYDSESN